MFPQVFKGLLPVLGLLAQCASVTSFPTPATPLAVDFLLPPRSSFLEPRQDVSNTASNSSHNHTGHGEIYGSSRKSILADFPIHESCNASQTLQIQSGLDDMKLLLQSSIHHLLLHGNNSDLFQLYFGADADPAVPLGYYTRMLSGDKTGTLFRCDDIDGNCQFPEWNGHWRGNNASGETVICELSYYTRLPIQKACSFGWTMTTGDISSYWGTDLMHRAMHLPLVTNEKVGHTADSYTALVALAKNDTAASVHNQHTLQTFAFDVWARENVAPDGCVGGDDAHAHNHDDEDGADADNATSTASNAPASSGTNSSTSAEPAAATNSTAGSDCHTHADGEIHCGSH